MSTVPELHIPVVAALFTALSWRHSLRQPDKVIGQLTRVRVTATNLIAHTRQGHSPDPTPLAAANRDVRLLAAVLPLSSPLPLKAGTPSRPEDLCCKGARAGRMAPRASSPGEGIGDGGLSTQAPAP